MLVKRNLIFLSLFILLVLILSSCFLNPPASEGILKGQIMVPEGSILTKDLTGQALPDATVNIIDLATGAIIATTVTDADGYYQVSVPPGGPYLLEAVKDGIKVQQITPQVEVGIEYELGTADCTTTSAALIAQAMMDAGDNPSDIECEAIIADPNFSDVSSAVCSTIEAGGDPAESAVIQQVVEDFLSPPEPPPTPSPLVTTYTVVFDSQGGSAVNSQAVEPGEKVSEPTAPTKTGYTFGGWYKESGCTNTWNFDSDTVIADVTLYAQWTINTYTVTFNKNGGDTEADPITKTATYGGNVGSLPTEPTRTGYTFTGWNTGVDGGGTEFTATTAVTYDITVYAQWVGPVHNITQNTYYTAIQLALDAANSGDIIEVDDGTYAESITFPNGKVITLRSLNGSSYTTIIGVNGFATVTSSNCPDGTTLEGFMITHNYGNSGRGIAIAAGYLTINNCTISDNSSVIGGGIYNYAGTLTVTGSTISGNSATDNGGGINNSGTLTITGSSTISNNSAVLSGGGIINSAALTVTDSTISGNSANDGGGIHNDGALTVTDSTISGNSANDGGGIHNYWDSTLLTITGSTISGNSAASDGGGIHNYTDCTTTITGSTISGNSATDFGGGIDNSYGGTLIITGSTISGNSATWEGGGIYNGDTLIITDSTISDNSTATWGGGINSSGIGASLDITGSIISDNSATLGGGGIFSWGTDDVIIGGNSGTDTDNFNNFIGNYKTGDSPSADQHIRKHDATDVSVDCHASFPNNYFNPGP